MRPVECWKCHATAASTIPKTNPHDAVTDSEHEGNSRNVIHSVTTIQPELVECITPPEGTDVRAVKWRDEPAPVVVGDVTVRA